MGLLHHNSIHSYEYTYIPLSKHPILNECQCWYAYCSMRSFICCGNQELLKGATCVYILHGSSTIAVVDPGGFIGFHGTPLLKGCLRKYQYAQTYYIHYAHTRATHFSFTLAITHNLPVHVNSIISCIKNSMRAWPTCTYILSEAHGNHRDNERSEERIKAKFFFYLCNAPSAARDGDMLSVWEDLFSRALRG